jgi:UDP-glucose 4-epimerase
LENIDFLQKDDRFRDRLFVRTDTILNHETMVELIGICDTVFHLAAAVGVKYILDYPLESIKTNIQGTEKVLELCAKFRKKVLIASSSEVYGKHTHAPLVETDNIIYGPSSKFRWSYAASKLMDEFTALAYFRTKGLKVTIARLFNTIGTRQTGTYGMVVPRLIGQALKNEPLTVYGDGMQTRTFTGVKDVVQVFMGMIEEDESFGQVFNIGGTEEISILDLAKKIIALSGSTSEIVLTPYEEAYEADFEDMMRRVPSVEKVFSLVGFKPDDNLDRILQNIITFMSN